MASSPKKSRFVKPKKSNIELISLFWSAPSEARFDQFVTALIVGCSPKTLESNRWKRCGIPFAKVEGRVLYKKADVISWLESFPIVNSTSEYKNSEAAYAK